MPLKIDIENLSSSACKKVVSQLTIGRKLQYNSQRKSDFPNSSKTVLSTPEGLESQELTVDVPEITSGTATSGRVRVLLCLFGVRSDITPWSRSEYIYQSYGVVSGVRSFIRQ